MITFLGLSPALDVTYLVETVVPGGIHRPTTTLTLPGGKSLNAARAAAVLGGMTQAAGTPVTAQAVTAQAVTAQAVTALGGFTGERVAAALADSGVRLRRVPTQAETRTCVTVFGADGSDPTEFYEPAPAFSGAEWAALADAVQTVDGGWIALSGSVPAAHIGEIATMMADAAARSIRIAVDTHGAALRAILDAAPPAVVKVNRSEAIELLGEASTVALAEGLHRQGAAVAIVTDGAEGAVLTSATGTWRAAPPARGRYAVGSGDCFFAGILVALDAGAEPHDALALATALAAANTARPGAVLFEPDLFASGEFERLRRSVAVERSTIDAP